MICFLSASKCLTFGQFSSLRLHLVVPHTVSHCVPPWPVQRGRSSVHELSRQIPVDPSQVCAVYTTVTAAAAAYKPLLINMLRPSNVSVQSGFFFTYS